MGMAQSLPFMLDLAGCEGMIPNSCFSWRDCCLGLAASPCFPWDAEMPRAGAAEAAHTSPPPCCSGRTQRQLLEHGRKAKMKSLPFERYGGGVEGAVPGWDTAHYWPRTHPCSWPCRKHYASRYDERQCRSSPDLLTDVSKQVFPLGIKVVPGLGRGGGSYHRGPSWQSSAGGQARPLALWAHCWPCFVPLPGWGSQHPPSAPAQVEELRLAYGGRGPYHANGVHASEPTLDSRRRSSAVEVTFAAELERSKPEASPSFLPHSKSSSAFPLLYAELELERAWEAADLFGARNPLTSFRPHQFTGNSKSPSVGNMREVSTRPLVYTDVPCPPPMAAPAPQVLFYLDRPPQPPCHAPVPGEDTASGRSPAATKPLRRSPSGTRAGEFHRKAACVAAGASVAPAGESRLLARSFDYGLQEQPPKRSWSQSDMKTIRFPYGSEFRPLGPCPALSSRKAGIFRHTPAQQGLAPGLRRSAERYVGSSTESSDSDSDLLAADYCSLYGRVLRSPMARVRLSSGSLQLDEEDEEVSFATGAAEERTSRVASRYFT